MNLFIAADGVFHGLAWRGIARRLLELCGVWCCGWSSFNTCVPFLSDRYFITFFSITIHKRVFITIFFILKVCKNLLYNNHAVGMKRSRRRRWNEIDKQKYLFFKNRGVQVSYWRQHSSIFT